MSGRWSVLPQDVDFQPFAAFPPGVMIAVVVGDPAKPGPFTIRVKAPAGAKLPPHRHHEDRSRASTSPRSPRSGRSAWTTSTRATIHGTERSLRAYQRKS
jgi:hypothetical protein